MKKDSLSDRMKQYEGIKKMKPSEFLEYAFGIKLFAYQKVLVDTLADKKKFYFPIYRRVGLK